MNRLAIGAQRVPQHDAHLGGRIKHDADVSQ